MHKKKLSLLILILYVSLMIIMSVNRSRHINERSDFFVYWKTGQNFFHGDELYSQQGEIRAFIYPPFAAFIFQALSAIPFKISAIFFFLLNSLVLPIIVIYLLFRLLKNYGLSQKDVFLPVVFSILASFNYFWNNLNMLQVNYLLFTISITGIFFLSEKKYSLAAVFFVIATFIKIYPVFLLIYTFLLYPKRRVIISITASVIMCLALPALQRGLSKGIDDHQKYYETFLKEFKEGKVVPDLKNHTIKSFIIKASSKTPNIENINISDYKIHMAIANIFLLFMFATILLAIYKQIRVNHREFSFLILSAIFIFTHMISGITWSAHLVTAVFWYLPLFLIDWKKFNNPFLKAFHLALIIIAFFLSIEGTDTTGKNVYILLRSFDVFVVYPVVLFFYYLILYFKGERNIYKEVTLR